ncbi:unnamed protein product [Nezara viridula]|uniref:Uncharacterized protein n=1 Tax=Nezara viridula TaxID=85310 RepID=A0A9P0H2L8_NEZVI|nr:unnamed protein product [Nezara viridula]
MHGARGRKAHDFPWASNLPTWTGHVIRRNELTWARQFMDWYPREHVRKRGRPPTYMDKEMKTCGGAAWKRADFSFGDAAEDIARTTVTVRLELEMGGERIVMRGEGKWGFGGTVAWLLQHSIPPLPN